VHHEVLDLQQWPGHAGTAASRWQAASLPPGR
jgi:hypothetical protein